MTPYLYLQLIELIINDPSTLESARFLSKSFTRNRKMTFADALYFFLDMQKTSLQTRLNLYFKGRISMSEQAFSKLRNNFDHSPFEKMYRALVDKEYTTNKDLGKWNGYYLLSVDGTYLLLPKTQKLEQAFGCRGGGKGAVSAGSSVLYDVLNGWPIDPILTHSSMNEREECKNHLNFLCESLPDVARNSVILLDRGYPSIKLFEDFIQKNMKFLARCAKNYSLATTNAPMGDSIVELAEGLSVRVCKLELENSEIETLVTNLFDVPYEDLGTLYAMRWSIEGLYFKLKNIISIEKFSGRTPNAIRQDFWASMVIMIGAAVFQRDADKIVEIERNGKSNKHPYRARTSDLVINLRNNFIFSVFRRDPNCMDFLQQVVELCSKSVSAVQPNRHFKRSFPVAANKFDNLKSRL